MILEYPTDPLVSIMLPMPPSDNNLVRLARLGAYPTHDYREWLRVCAPILDDAIADRRAHGCAWDDHDTLVRIGRRPWFSVYCQMVMPSGRRDSANYEKALFDLLGGKRCESEKKSCRLVIGPGVWPDDSLIGEHSLAVVARGGDDHWVHVHVCLSQPPEPLDIIAKLRHRCERRLKRMADGEVPRCVCCNTPVTMDPMSRTIIVPGPGTVTAVLCDGCIHQFKSADGRGRSMVLSRPDLFWEHAHQILNSTSLYAATLDLIWD